MFKPLNVVAAPQVEVLRKLPANGPNRSLQEGTGQVDQRQQQAVINTALLFGGFRKCEADDPEIYSRTVEHVLARYDVDIQRSVADPSRWKFPPTAYEVRQDCEALAQERERAHRRDKALAEQLARRREDEARGERKALTYQPRAAPEPTVRVDHEIRQANEILARYQAEAEAANRRQAAAVGALSVFEIDPDEWRRECG